MSNSDIQAELSDIHESLSRLTDEAEDKETKEDLDQLAQHAENLIFELMDRPDAGEEEANA